MRQRGRHSREFLPEYGETFEEMGIAFPGQEYSATAERTTHLGKRLLYGARPACAGYDGKKYWTVST